MKTLYRAVASSFDPIGALEFEAIAATNALQDDGVALDMNGADLDRFKSGGPLCLNHNADCLVGQVTNVRAAGGKLRMRGRFPTPGLQRADEARGLLKDGLQHAVHRLWY